MYEWFLHSHSPPREMLMIGKRNGASVCWKRSGRGANDVWRAHLRRLWEEVTVMVMVVVVVVVVGSVEKEDGRKGKQKGEETGEKEYERECR
ncbi:hypothetical protein E2C01_000860 [Portunus trituberculatus]|uniref:Uncharacterized protein n=1 Tax=Portunus trituberculatus TaxID=210409 RepID=A0A5B7CFF9_PORTR|nr:hypothetical protein [Portunus trituberculatus]